MNWTASVSLVALAVGLGGCAVATEPTTAPSAAGAASDEAASAKPAHASPETEMILRSPCATRPPVYLLRIPDNDGAAYWSDMRNPPTANPDGYTVPFPTPWITNNSNTLVDWYAHLSYEPDVFTYEADQWGLPSSQDYEYLVREIAVGTCTPSPFAPPTTCFRGYVDPQAKEWFTVPFTSWSDLQAATNFAYSTPYTSPDGTNYSSFYVEPRVNAEIRECVHIVDGNGVVGSPVTPVEFDIFVEIHDPDNPPR